MIPLNESNIIEAYLMVQVLIVVCLIIFVSFALELGQPQGLPDFWRLLDAGGVVATAERL